MLSGLTCGRFVALEGHVGKLCWEIGREFVEFVDAVIDCSVEQMYRCFSVGCLLVFDTELNNVYCGPAIFIYEFSSAFSSFLIMQQLWVSGISCFTIACPSRVPKIEILATHISCFYMLNHFFASLHNKQILVWNCYYAIKRNMYTILCIS